MLPIGLNGKNVKHKVIQTDANCSKVKREGKIKPRNVQVSIKNTVFVNVIRYWFEAFYIN